MSENIRKLSKRIAVPRLPAPYRNLDAHAGGVGDGPTSVDGKEFHHGADEGFVANSAARLHYRFNKALADYEATKATLMGGKKPKTEDVAEYSALKKLDEMAELVRRFAVEAGPDGSGAVTADMAAALGSLDKPQLAMILRRAGNPPLFQPLLGGDLADVPMLRESDKVVHGAKVAREQKKLDAKSSVESLPLWMRPSSHIGDRQKLDNFEPKDNDPMQFDAKDPGLAQSTKDTVLTSLAGDQMGQVREMKKSGKGRLTIGVGRSGDDIWNQAPQKRDSGRKIDAVVDSRNKGAFRRLAEQIDAAGYDRAGNATEGTFDLDKVFPRWRARPGEVDASGKVAYPARLPSAEYVTGMIIGLHKFTEPGLYKRWLPIVRRSIDAAPDEPSTPKALTYSKTVFRPSKKFQSVMEQGVGSKDYPHALYGPRKIAPPAVDETPAKPAPTQESLQSRIDRLKKSRAKPGNADQSSIYMVPPNSQMSGLLA